MTSCLWECYARIRKDISKYLNWIYWVCYTMLWNWLDHIQGAQNILKIFKLNESRQKFARKCFRNPLLRVKPKVVDIIWRTKIRTWSWPKFVPRSSRARWLRIWIRRCKFQNSGSEIADKNSNFMDRTKSLYLGVFRVPDFESKV